MPDIDKPSNITSNLRARVGTDVRRGVQLAVISRSTEPNSTVVRATQLCRRVSKSVTGLVTFINNRSAPAT